MKEKSKICINLPKGAKYLREEVTEEAVSILYTIKSKPKKPKPLIGGTEVYQKDNGTNYWYCRIKDGRDEFMNLYYRDLTRNDILYTEDGKERKLLTQRQIDLCKNLCCAIPDKAMCKDEVWIPVYEPSMDSDGNLQFVSGEKVFTHFTHDQWINAFKNYSPENRSNIASSLTYFLLLLRLMKDGFVTFEQLADDSTELGHFWNSNGESFGLQKTGERQLGGLYGFAGNTTKLLSSDMLAFDYALRIAGGDFRCKGWENPLANCEIDNEPNYPDHKFAIGLLALFN